MAVFNSLDNFAGASNDALSVPATRLVAVSASSSTFPACRAFVAKTGETIVVDGLGGGTDVSLPVVAGQVYPIRIIKVSTSTGGLVLLY